MGLDHEKLTYFHQGRDERLTDVYGTVVTSVVALLVAHSPFRKIPREELMRRVVIDATGLTHQYA